MIPLPAQSQDCHGLGGMPGTGRQAANAALQVRDPLFQYVAGWIHDAGINIPAFLQRKKPRGMVGILKNIRGCLVNGNCPRSGYRVWNLTGMKLAGGKTKLAFLGWFLSILIPPLLQVNKNIPINSRQEPPTCGLLTRCIFIPCRKKRVIS